MRPILQVASLRCHVFQQPLDLTVTLVSHAFGPTCLTSATQQLHRSNRHELPSAAASDLRHEADHRTTETASSLCSSRRSDQLPLLRAPHTPALKQSYNAMLKQRALLSVDHQRAPRRTYSERRRTVFGHGLMVLNRSHLWLSTGVPRRVN